VDLLLVKQAL